MKDIMKNRLTELSDSEFLSFLYSERDREESLTSYQGWSIWAIWGAIVTVTIAIYSILSNHYEEILILNTGYILSGIFAFVLCYRPYFLFTTSLVSRERGVDYKKVKYLKDVAPNSYLWFTLIISICFSVFFLIIDKAGFWNKITIGWIIVAMLNIVGVVACRINKDKIVMAGFEGLVFGEKRYDSLYYGVVSGVLSNVWLNSLIKNKGRIFGNPDFELAVCIATILILLYLFLEFKSREKISSRMDVLLDDFIYKYRDKSDIYHQMQVLHMGYSVLEVCSREVYQLKNSFKDFEPQKEKVEEYNRHLSNGRFNINDIDSYIHVMQSAFRFIKQLKIQSEALERKIKQIENQVPRIEEVEEYRGLLIIVNKLLEQENNVIKMIYNVVDQMDDWIKNRELEVWEGSTREFLETRNYEPKY